ncbi:hypothetical protein BDV32DRAFT_108713 [Aspergillus pseudonomiae]|uniref:Uncharacterized protein n=1 Tax=Aspergillus pseudonomiae TaxID=1506151 RepID=A0A5N7DDJ9_9EURO|nr:uncharacterized protein BDV37DRAFT_118315 [Aspergillus pseudonomiae]KAB8255745.1 hypothetical protein BDV32DRAFT_108713 [Aspergillus pseudonomiae]KAE8404083.1 hypothetical protein BDV37DRAFT_118315 [Aspergillus pseudonomiae]
MVSPTFSLFLFIYYFLFLISCNPSYYQPQLALTVIIKPKRTLFLCYIMYLIWWEAIRPGYG